MIEGKKYNKLVKIVLDLQSWERDRMSSSGRFYIDELVKLLEGNDFESVFDKWKEAGELVYDEDEKGITTKVAQ